MATYTRFGDEFAYDSRDLTDAEFRTYGEALMWSNERGLDLYVPKRNLHRFAGSPAATEAAAGLVAKGWWEDRGDRWYIGLYHPEWHPTREQVQRERAANTRRQALWRDEEIRQAVRERDADLCRYCGCAVRWGGVCATNSGVFEHVDPEGDNSLENLVVACTACNTKKGPRTPEQAGMVLLDPPGVAVAAGSGD